MSATNATLPAFAHLNHLAIPLPPDAVHEIVNHTAQDDERMWMRMGESVWSRPLLFNVTQGWWVNLTKATATGVVSRHRHPAPVTGYTLDGSWGYLEHDWVARKGTFIFEPPGETHTLVVLPEAGHMLTLFHNFGPVLYVDEQGRQTGFEDVFTRLARYKKHCNEVGLGEAFVKPIIR